SVDTITGFFFESMVAAKEGQRVPVAPEELRLAACAVLLELAHAANRFAEGERKHLEDLIRRTFDLEEAQARKLIELAEQQRVEPKHIARFTSLIARSYTTEEKITLVKDMWDLVLSDGELAVREQYLIHRIARLLGLDAGAVAAARAELEQTTGRDAGERRS
ncbi:MAG: TerB family tellurite resistance protein, partial [Gemmatimonadetes bacterium]|nr:TerB family tellurite resistance protein [Gemmatimonadota bacterium]